VADNPRATLLGAQDANILNKMPKSLHTKAKRALQEIWMAETKKMPSRHSKPFSKPTRSNTRELPIA